MQWRLHYEQTIERLAVYQERHPYRFAFIISFLILLIILFYQSPEWEEGDFGIVEPMEMIEVMLPKASSPKKMDISTEAGETDPMDEVIGAIESDAVDLAFNPDVAPPRLIGRLKKDYPTIARELDVEATVYVEILIDAEGKVVKVGIIGVKLHKELPPEDSAKIKKAFVQSTLKTLANARYTPTIINGEQVPIKQETPVFFSLTD